MADTTIYLLVAAMLGVLVALVLSIRRLNSLELKSESMINSTKRIDVRSISIEERILEIQRQMLGLLKKKGKS